MNYVNNNIENENIRIFNNYVGIVWDPGLLDYYSVIIYDENNNLDFFVKSSEDKITDKETYYEFKETFKYEKITSIVKIEDKYFRCKIRE